MAKMEDEIREEMAEEMEKMMNQMEETYQAKLQRETAIHEEKFSVRQHSPNRQLPQPEGPPPPPIDDYDIVCERSFGTAF